MTDLRRAAQQALEALEYHVEQTRPIWKTSEAIAALQAALEEHVDQPVAWIYEFWADPGHKGLSWERQDFADNTPLYTHPPQTKTNQCGETCERAKMCAVCLSRL